MKYCFKAVALPKTLKRLWNFPSNKIFAPSSHTETDNSESLLSGTRNQSNFFRCVNSFSPHNELVNEVSYQ